MNKKEGVFFVVFILFLTLLVGFSSASLCYQESANVSTSCGGLATGAYGGDYGEAIDANWSSYINTSFNQTIYVNYTKPSLATNNSLLQIKLDSGAIKSAIPSACLDQNKLQIKLNITSYITIEDYGGENSPNINGVYDLINPTNKLYYNNQEDNSFYIYPLLAGCFKVPYEVTSPTFGISSVPYNVECMFYNNDFLTPAGIYSAYDLDFASGSGLATENFSTTVSCYTGSDWQIINSSFGSGLIYEEAMLWDFTDSANSWRDNESLTQTIDNCGILTTPNAIYTLNSSINSSADYITKNYITVRASGSPDPDISGTYYEIGSYNGNSAYYNRNYYMFYAEGVYNIGNYLGSGILFNNVEANPLNDYNAYDVSASGWATAVSGSEVKCIEIRASNITFNMNWKNITGDNTIALYVISSSGNSYVSILNGTVENFGSEDNQAYGIYLGSGENNTLENINLVNINKNLYLNNVGFNNFRNITLTYGEDGLYAYEVYSSIFSNINSSANGVGLFLEKSIENSFYDALLQFNGWGLRFEQNSLRNRFYNAYISNSSEYSLLSSAWSNNLNNSLIYNNSYGRIEYSLIGSIVSNLIFGNDIIINNNFVSVDSTNLPELNISANVTLYGLPTNWNTDVGVLRNGVACPANICTLHSFSEGVAKFNVSFWSNYSFSGSYVNPNTGGGGREEDPPVIPPVEPPCIAQCSGKTCGSDGCGGSCGSCGSLETCTSNQCVLVPECVQDNDCGNLEQCTNGVCQAIFLECISDSGCSSDKECKNNKCVLKNCLSSCFGKTCGSDGCGGSCGSCSDGSSCSNFRCVDGEKPVTLPVNSFLINSGDSGCNYNFICGDWGECQTNYSLVSILGDASLSGIRSRKCIDKNNCRTSFMESKVCLLKENIVVKNVFIDGKNYTEVYDLFNKLLARLTLGNDGKAVNVDFALTGNLEEEICTDCNSRQNLYYVSSWSLLSISLVLFVASLVLFEMVLQYFGLSFILKVYKFSGKKIGTTFNFFRKI